MLCKRIEKGLFHKINPLYQILATLAAVVASQGLISGAFSLSAQAIALGLFPRLKKVHTHEEHSGQIYLPFINWALFLGATAMVLGFRTSNHLASAYGLTVAAVMLCSSLAMVAIANLCWGWSLLKSTCVFGSFAFLDLIFLGANSLRILEGGFIPLLLGFLIFVVIRIWRWGRKATYRAYQDKDGPSIQDLIVKKQRATESIPRNVVLMVPRQVQSLERCTPPLVQFFLNRYGMLPKNLFLVEVVHNKIPFIHGSRSENITYFKDPEKGSLVSVVIRFGFMEEPNVELVLEELAKAHAIS